MVSTQGRTHGPPARIAQGSRVDLPRGYPGIRGALLNDERVQGLTVRQLWLLFYLLRQPGEPFPRVTDLARLFSVSKSCIGKALQKLRELGLIEGPTGVCPGVRPKAKKGRR